MFSIRINNDLEQKIRQIEKKKTEKIKSSLFEKSDIVAKNEYYSIE